ncbi:hypothetical protein LCM02_00485 [Lutimonas saemankumensis]|uniref:hypothetical protein n=1 Tax=Lutimonas saemankumensis TaxID=483016 RepID=UPI001CD31AE1|nr:hypothetical protein [Lutimonas saemankumensis]MCA0930904.1 hypothetical protein [Lutimonas saemankumensis]
MKKILLSVIMTLISLSFVSAQEKEKLSPVELMFEYYNDEFKPFNKGKWFTALTFNIEDENLQSGNKLIGFDKIIEGQSFNYEVKLKGGYSIGNYSFVGLGITHGRDKSEGKGIILLDTLNSESVTNKILSLLIYVPTTLCQKIKDSAFLMRLKWISVSETLKLKDIITRS